MAREVLRSHPPDLEIELKLVPIGSAGGPLQLGSRETAKQLEGEQPNSQQPIERSKTNSIDVHLAFSIFDGSPSAAALPLDIHAPLVGSIFPTRQLQQTHDSQQPASR